MATARSRELRELAQRVEAALPQFATDAILTGSVSRGVADELSDVELLVVSDRLPDSLPLDELDSWTPEVEGAMWYGGSFEGEDVELVWWTPALADERVRAIAAGEIVDHARLKAAEAITNGIRLRGERHRLWVERLASYPAGLAAAIVDDAADAWIEPIRARRSLLRSGDSLMLAQRLVEDAERILRVVFALNEEWEPGWKRLAACVEPLSVQPKDLATRIDATIRTLDARAMRSLAAETLELAPQTAKTRRALELLREPL